MLNGKELGAAIAAAIQMKIDSGAIRSKAEVAREFEIKPPSLYDWERKGTIDKARLPKLWEYFSDVAGPEHWGLTAEEWPAGLSARGGSLSSPSVRHASPGWPYPSIDEAKFRAIKERDACKLEGAILLAAAQLGLDVKK